MDELDRWLRHELRRRLVWSVVGASLIFVACVVVVALFMYGTVLLLHT